MSDEHDLLDKIEKLHVLQAHKDDLIIIEYTLGAVTHEQLQVLYEFFISNGYEKVRIIGVWKDRGPLRISAVTDEAIT